MIKYLEWGHRSVDAHSKGFGKRGNEIAHLRDMLDDAGISYEASEIDADEYKVGAPYDYNHIEVFDGKRRIASVIEEHDGTLELMGLLTSDEKRKNNEKVVGGLSADDVMKRIERYFDNKKAGRNKRTKTEAVRRKMEDVDSWNEEQQKVYNALLELPDEYAESTARSIADNEDYRLWYGCHDMEDVAWEELDDIFDNIDNAYRFLRDFVDLEQFGYYLYTNWNFVECEDGMIQVY